MDNEEIRDIGIPESDLNWVPELGKAGVDELKGRIQESLKDVPNEMIEQVYDNWRIARDQLSRATDLFNKALARMQSDLTTYFVALDENCICNRVVCLSVFDVGDALTDITGFVTRGTEELDAKRKKRGSKRQQGKSIVRISRKEGPIGTSTLRILPDGTKEKRTLVDYIDMGGGQMMPKFTLETVSADASLEDDEVITKIVRDDTPKIQRPSLEEKQN